MRVKTLIATTDNAYTGHISDYISEHYAHALEVSVCNNTEQLEKALAAKRFDVALFDPLLIKSADTDAINLPMLLWSDSDDDEHSSTVTRIKKHRRISTTVADVLEQYATMAKNVDVGNQTNKSITVVWSPVGGVGKTTVSLAFALYAKHSGQNRQREVFYLTLEPFTATTVYFENPGKSISSALEMLDNKDGSLKLFLQGIRSSENGISYLGAPDNYDDICVLTPENTSQLVECACAACDELVVDMPSCCDMKTRKVLQLADRVLLVTDNSQSSKEKLSKFITQSDVYRNIKDKTTLVINKDTLSVLGDKYGSLVGSIVKLPYLQGTEGAQLCQSLSSSDYWE